MIRFQVHKNYNRGTNTNLVIINPHLKCINSFKMGGKKLLHTVLIVYIHICMYTETLYPAHVSKINRIL